MNGCHLKKPFLICSFFLVFFCGIQICAQISGKVVDSNYQPVNKIFVEAIPAELQSKPTLYEVFEVLTDEDGRFKFETLKAGRYFIAVNFVSTPDISDPYPTTFFPGVPDISQAAIFEIHSDSAISNILISLPPKLLELSIKGRIFQADGKPAFDAHVRLHNQESKLVVSDCRTDKNGNFKIKGFVGGEYHIETDNYKMTGEYWDDAESDVFILNAPMKNMKLVLKSNKEKLESLSQQK